MRDGNEGERVAQRYAPLLPARCPDRRCDCGELRVRFCRYPWSV